MGNFKSFKKVVLLVMLVVFTASFGTPVVTPAMASGLKYISSFTGGNGGGAKGNNETIYFGSFWQNGETLTKDTAKQGIKWRVLANDKANKQVLLLADQGLYADQFNSATSKGHDWKGSDIQKTLNKETATTFKADGTVEAWGGFAGDAFDAKELGAIKATKVEIDGKVVSQDKLFLLSGYRDYEGGNPGGEVYTKAYGFGANETRVMGATQFAQKVKLYGNNDAVLEYGGFDWWLRSPDSFAPDWAFFVALDGDVTGTTVDVGVSAVRPALNLNPESVLFLSAAVGGKNSAACRGAFALPEVDTTAATFEGWKVTLKDGTSAPTRLSATVVAGGGFDVNKLAEAAGQDGTLNIMGSLQDEKLAVTSNEALDLGDKFLSALLYNNTGNTMLNYAKVATGDIKAGDVNNVSLASVAAGDYQVKFFTETVADDYLTDYASELTAAILIPVHGVVTTLKSEYGTKGLTANLSDNAVLGFEAGTYDTKINIDPDNNGKITADAAGTTIEKVSVGSGATLAFENKFDIAKQFTVGKDSLLKIRSNFDSGTADAITTAGLILDGTDTLKIQIEWDPGFATWTSSVGNKKIAVITSYDTMSNLKNVTGVATIYNGKTFTPTFIFEDNKMFIYLTGFSFTGDGPTPPDAEETVTELSKEEDKAWKSIIVTGDKIKAEAPAAVWLVDKVDSETGKGEFKLDSAGATISATSTDKSGGPWVYGMYMKESAEGNTITLSGGSATISAINEKTDVGAGATGLHAENLTVKTGGNGLTVDTVTSVASGGDPAAASYGINLLNGATLDLTNGTTYGTLTIGSKGITSTAESSYVYGLDVEGGATVNAGVIDIKNVSGMTSAAHSGGEIIGVRLSGKSAGSGTPSTINTNGENLTVAGIIDNSTENDGVFARGVIIDDGAKLDLSKGEGDTKTYGKLTIGADGEGKGIKSTGGAAYGLNVTGGATVNTGEIDIKNVSGYSDTYGARLDGEGTSVKTNGNDVTVEGIQSGKEATGLYLVSSAELDMSDSSGKNYGTLTIGSNDAGKGIISTAASAYGLNVAGGAKVNSGEIYITNVSGVNFTLGAYLSGGKNTVSSNGKGVTIEGIQSNKNAYGIYVESSDNLDLTKDTTYGTLKIGAYDEGSIVKGIKSTAASAYGLYVNNGGTVNAGAIDIKNVSSGAERTYGAYLLGTNTSVKTNGEDITITGVQSGNGNDAYAYGVAQHNGAKLDLEGADKIGKLTIDGVKSTDMDAVGYTASGVTVVQKGSISIRNLETTRKAVAIALQGNTATTKLTLGYKDDDGTILSGGTYQLEGDVQASGLTGTVTSELKMALQNKDSYLYGNLLSTNISWGHTEPGNIAVDLLDGGKWYPVSVADPKFVNDATVTLSKGTGKDASEGVIDLAYSGFKMKDGKYERDTNDALIPEYNNDKTDFATATISNLVIKNGLLKIQSALKASGSKADALVASALTVGDGAELKIQVMYDPAFKDATDDITGEHIAVLTATKVVAGTLSKDMVTGVATMYGDKKFTPTFYFDADNNIYYLTGFLFGDGPVPPESTQTVTELSKEEDKPWKKIDVTDEKIKAETPAAVWLEDKVDPKAGTGEFKLDEKGATISATSTDKSGGLWLYGVYMKEELKLDHTITLSGGPATISAINNKADDGAGATGLYAEGLTVKTGGKGLTVETVTSVASGGDPAAASYGVNLLNGATLDLTNGTIYGTLTIGADGEGKGIKATNASAFGLGIYGGSTVNAGVIAVKNVSSNDKVSGIDLAEKATSVKTNGKDITIAKIQSSGQAAGISQYNDAELDFAKGKLTIDGVKSTGAEDLDVAVGYLVDQATAAHKGSVSIRNIEASKGAFAIATISSLDGNPAKFTLGYNDEKGTTLSGGTYQIEGDVVAAKVLKSATVELKMALQNKDSYLYGNLLTKFDLMSLKEKGNITLDL